MRFMAGCRLGVVAATLMLAGCAGSDSDVAEVTTAAADEIDDVASGAGGIDETASADGDSEAVDDTSGQDASSDSDAASGGADQGELSVDEITDLLFPSFEDFDGEEAQARYENEERERQLVIVECMTAQGFEYTPVDYSSFDVFGPDEDIDYASREYAETYGFGMTTFDEMAVMTEEVFQGEEFRDPNQEYVESLSEGARAAYDEALYGDHPEFDASMTDEEMEAQFEENPELFRPQGCEGEAYEQTSQFAGMDQVYMEFGDDFAELYERVQTDPRIVAVEDEWAECMADKGHTYGAQQDMYEDLSERSQVLYAGFEDMDFPVLTDAEADAMTEEELQQLFAPPEIDKALQAEIQDYEITVAVDSWDCGGMSRTNSSRKSLPITRPSSSRRTSTVFVPRLPTTSDGGRHNSRS